MAKTGQRREAYGVCSLVLDSRREIAWSSLHWEVGGKAD